LNTDENVAQDYLRSLQLGEVVREPDGKVPPDFLVGNRIAVEVRRLSKTYEEDGKLRSLEQDTIPIRQGLERLLTEFVGDEQAWFVFFNCHRPLVTWKELRSRVRRALKHWLASPVDSEQFTIPITETFSITMIPAREGGGHRFVPGGLSDRDASGWVVFDVITNATVCIAEKNKKVAAFRAKYPEWWLIFIDYIGMPSEAEDVRRHITRPKEWNRVIFLNHDGQAYDI
jgi:hypothetical protein